MKRPIYSKLTFPPRSLTRTEPVRLLVVARRERGFPSRSHNFPNLARVGARETDSGGKKISSRRMIDSSTGTKGILEYRRRRR